MTALAERRPTAPVVAPAPSSRRRPFRLAVLALVALTGTLRAVQQTSAYELFVDEIQYADLANSWASGRGQELFGEPFFLHPPLFFAAVGLVLATVGGGAVPDLTTEMVLGLRWVELGPAALNVVLVVAVARRLTGRGPALVAGLLYALDPFVIRFDSRLMLEAPTMTWVLAGVLAAMVAAERDRARWPLLILAGTAFGLAITTKSTSALVTTVPLVLVLLTGWGLRRVEALVAMVVQFGVYAAYLVVVVLTGHGADWSAQTLSGVVRVSGVATETGFNAVGRPSLTDRIVANLQLFAPSYLLIGVAVGYGTWLLVTSFRSLRVDGPVGAHARGGRSSGAVFLCWLAGVAAALGYTVVLGELEEQTFYLLSVPATIVVAVLVGRMGMASLPWRAVALLAVALVAGGAGAVWWTVHTVPDDAYRRFAAALDAGLLPRGSHLALGEHTAQFVTPGQDLRPLDQDGTGGDYALVSTQLSALDLAPVPTSTITALEAAHPLLFSASGRTVGELRLYDLTKELPR